MGPAEGGKRPCYPTPCNADWTACTTSTPSLWDKITSHIGKRPVCDSVAIRSDGVNYQWGTLEGCQNSCLNEPTGLCNIVSRYGTKSDTSNWHCWFYACKDHTYVWEPQTSWGNGASSSIVYTFPYRHHQTQYKTVNKTNWVDKIRWTNKTNWVDKIRWTNKTNIETNWVDKIRWTNKTVNKTVIKIRWIDNPKHDETVRTVDGWTTKSVNQTADVANTQEMTLTDCDDFAGALQARESLLLGVLLVLIIAFIWRECKRCCRREYPQAPPVPEVIAYEEKTKV